MRRMVRLSFRLVPICAVFLVVASCGGEPGTYDPLLNTSGANFEIREIAEGAAAAELPVAIDDADF